MSNIGRPHGRFSQNTREIYVTIRDKFSDKEEFSWKDVRSRLPVSNRMTDNNLAQAIWQFRNYGWLKVTKRGVQRQCSYFVKTKLFLTMRHIKKETPAVIKYEEPKNISAIEKMWKELKEAMGPVNVPELKFGLKYE